MALDIKICGLSTPEAVAAALDGGASHVGFIFFDKSPRNVTPDQAAQLREAASGMAKAVAVTVDAEDSFLDELVSVMAPDMLQLHGREPPARVAEVASRYGLPVMKSFAIAEADDLEAVQAYVGIAERFLFDARPPKGSELPGGNGIAFDWRLLQGLEGGLDYMLSGGLDARNIEAALDLVNPPGIDVSSGLETAPGVKDPALIREFLALARGRS